MPPGVGMTNAFLGVTMRQTTDLSSVPAVFNKTSISQCGTSGKLLRRRGKVYARVRRALLTLLATLTFLAPAWAQNAPSQDQNASLFGLPSRQHLFGDWGGERTALAEKGFTFDS